MARDITAPVRADLNASASPNILLAFLTIDHASLPEPIRVVCDPIDFMVGSELYVGCPFEFKLLNDDEAPPTTQIRVQNVDRRIGNTLLSITGRASLALEVRSSADFDLSVVPRMPTVPVPTVLYGFRFFSLIDVTGTPLDITGTLMLRDYTQEPWPSRRATQARCPGLFR